MSVTLNGTSGLVFSDGSSQGTAGFTGFRNRLINGAFNVWQRGTSRTYLTGTSGYLADRWSGSTGYQNAAHQRVAVSSAPSGLKSPYAIRVGSSTTAEASGGTRMDLNQKIEYLNCYDLAGQTVTLSFWIRFSAATATSSTATAYSDFQIRFQQNTTTTDSASYTDTGDSVATVTAVSGSGMTSGGTTGVLTNGSLPTTWTKYTITASLSSSLKNVTLRMEFNGLGNTSAADSVWYEVAEVQLEKGGAATDFEYRDITTETAMCERYYQGDIIVAVGGGQTPAVTNRSFYQGSNWKTTFRTTPTLTLMTTVTNTNMGSAAWTSVSPSRGRFSAINTVTNDCFFEAIYSGNAEML